MTVLIITAQTGAATSTQFAVNKRVSKTVMANGLAGAEYVDIQIKDGAGSWITTSTANRLTATDPARTISTEGEYRLSKSATAAATSCSLTGA